MPEPTNRWIIKRNCSASPRQTAAVLASIAALRGEPRRQPAHELKRALRSAAA